MGACLSCSRPPGTSTAAAEPSLAASSLRAASGSVSRRARKRQMQEGTRNGRRDGGVRLRVVASSGYEVGEDELHRLPGRLFLNGANETACLHTQQGKKGANQDAMIVWENFISRNDTIFCGVFDGHGPFGHMVARKVRDSLPLKLSSQWRANLLGIENSHQIDCVSGSIDSEELTSLNSDELSESAGLDENDVPEMYLSLKQSFLKAFKIVDTDLKFNPIIDCFCSGTTAVTVVKQGQDLVIGNLGDSRAVMGTRDRENNLIAVQLTVDLKPNLPREAARIQQYKGRVFALQDEPEVARVWLPNSNSPGLAMARAFGDFCLKDYGLISVPDISYRRLTDKDEFIILATDGNPQRRESRYIVFSQRREEKDIWKVWDVLSNKEAVDIVASAPTCGTAARALVDSAVRSWRLKFPTSKIDDCAAVCLFLEKQSSTDQLKAVDSKNIPIQPAESAESPLGIEALHGQQINISVSDGTQTDAFLLARSNTLCDVDEILPAAENFKVPRVPERTQSTKSLADCISTAEEEEWSALDGITRVNSLLNLPRILSGEKRYSSWRNWL